MPPEPPPLEAQLRPLLGEEPPPALRALLAESEPVEVADAYYHFSLPDQLRLLGIMEPEQAADVLVELDETILTPLFSSLPPERAAAFLELMEPDDGVDLLELLEDEAAAAALEQVSVETRSRLTVLRTYSPDTAGGLMDPDVVQVRAAQSVDEAIHEIRRYVERVRLNDFFMIFVVDERRRLVGVVPNWRMLLARGTERVADIMTPDPLSVEAHLDQEEVSRLVWDHDLVTVPVVDSHRRLLGRITVDDVVDVIQEEHHEDLGRFTGTGGEGVLQTSVLQTLRDRAPWLMIALAGQLLAAVIMHIREDFIITLPQLALFIPAIMAMGGNTGVQSASLVIRGLGTGEVRMSHFWRRLGKETLVAFFIGLLFSLLLVTGGLVLTGNPALGVVVGISTLITIAMASTGGLVIPFILHRFDLDPALATGPFLTTMNDVLGILVYLLVAYLLLF